MTLLQRTSESTLSHDATDVRFGMRGLLLTMTGVAFAAAMFGHQFRGLRDDVRWHVALVWAVCSILVLALVARHARRRFCLERHAGRRIVALAPYGRFGPRLQSWLVGGGGLLLIIVGVAYVGGAASEFAGRRDVHTAYAQSALPCLLSAALIAGGIALIWWNRSIQLREHGVLRGLRLVLWTHVTDCHWRTDVLVVRGVDDRRNDIEWTAEVQSHECERVDSIVAQKLGAAYSPLSVAQFENESATTFPASSAEKDEGALPKRQMPIRDTALFPICPSGNSPMRRLRVVFSIYAMIIALVAFRPWEQQTTEFNVGAVIGCAAMALISLGEWWRSLPAGVPLIRLKPRLDWLSWMVALLVAVACCWLNRLLGPVVLLIDWLLGAACGASVFVVVAMLVREKFDLYEVGIVHFRARVLPWGALRIVKWSPNVKGALVLRSGIWRLRAKVPTELRVAVDAVLQEKLGSPDTATRPHNEVVVKGVT